MYNLLFIFKLFVTVLCVFTSIQITSISVEFKRKLYKVGILISTKYTKEILSAVQISSAVYIYDVTRRYNEFFVVWTG
jgi:hypothetical protein